MVYFKVEVWDFNVLTVVGIMFTNNHCGNFLLQKHNCYFHELSLVISVSEKRNHSVLKIKDIFCLKEKHVIVLKNAVLLPPFGKYRN